MKTSLLLLSALLYATPTFALPNFEFQDLKGARVQWTDSKNRELVVFWATWCTECREKLVKTLPELQKAEDISVVTINTDEELARAADYVRKNKITIPVLREPKGEFLKQLKIKAVPFWAVYTRTSNQSPWLLQDSAVAFNMNRVKTALGVK